MIIIMICAQHSAATVYYLYYLIILCDLSTSKIVFGLTVLSSALAMASIICPWSRFWPRENVLV